MPENLNFKINIEKSDAETREVLSRQGAFNYDPPSKLIHRGYISWQTFSNWLDKQTLDHYTKKEIIKEASKYPTGTLVSFVKNFSSHLTKINKKKREAFSEKKKLEG